VRKINRRTWFWSEPVLSGDALGKIVCGSCDWGFKKSTILKNEKHVLLWNVFDTFPNNVDA
jgi:hypothetical protein